MQALETPRCLLGIDIGTTTISAAVIDIERCRVSETRTEPNDTKLSADGDLNEYDARAIVQKVLAMADGLLTAYPNITSIGLTGQMHGIVYTDAGGQAVSPLYTWQDGRGNRSFDGPATYCDEIFRRTGHRVSTGYGFATLFYNHENHLEPSGAKSFCTIMDLIAMTLTGSTHPCIHASNAAALGLFDLKSNRFDGDAVQKLGLSNLQLPDICGDEPIGGCRGIPVSVAIGDNQACFYGSVREEKDTALVNFGTGSQISIAASELCSVDDGLEIRPYLFGKYLLCGSALCGGRAYSVLEKFFFAYASALSADARPQYEIMNALALEHYEQRQVLKVSTQFCGTRKDPSLRGFVADIGDGNFTPSALILGVLQGMTDELKQYFDRMNTECITHLVASGNAVQRNRALQRVLSDTFDCALDLTATNEEAAIGAALYAGMCGGRITAAQRQRVITYKGEKVMNKADFCIDFEPVGSGSQFWGEADGRRVLECILENGTLSVFVKYDFMDKPPLRLIAPAQGGDRVRLRVLPYRLELYVNGVLCDEEWPCGEHQLLCCTVTDNGCAPHFVDCDFEPGEEPAVLGTFRNAEGWQPEENVFVGDCMPYSHNGAYHVLYLKDRHHHRSKWGCGGHQWSHISTEDFDEWCIHPMAVELDDPHEGSICTGSWICDGDTHYLFYAIRMCDGSPAEIRRSVSHDGYHFEKDRDFLLTLSDRFTPPSARDPKMVRDANGLFHMILTTSLAQSGRGCLAHLVSEDLLNWRELDEPLYVAPEGMGEPECPDYFYKDGFYYLVYSLRGSGYYLYSDKPFSDWKQPQNALIPCKSVPKAAIWNDRLIFAGFSGNGVYAGTLTFLEAVVGADGTLTYKSLT